MAAVMRVGRHGPTLPAAVCRDVGTTIGDFAAGLCTIQDERLEGDSIYPLSFPSHRKQSKGVCQVHMLWQIKL